MQNAPAPEIKSDIIFNNVLDRVFGVSNL
jgi:hypothetical protein